MPKCSICGANSQGWCRCGVKSYKQAMRRFKRSRRIKGRTEQQKVKLEGRF